MSDLTRRFGGLARLYGEPGLERLQQAHVCVIGLGGVGSWAAEALARSAIGALTLVDLDEVCVSNVNRQLHASDETVGQAKAELMADRARAINPACHAVARLEFFTEATANELLTPRYDFVVDAIDSVSNKTRLIALCHARGLPVVSCGAAGGRRDATAVRVTDLAHVTHDRLLFEVRRRLRRDHGFPRGGRKLGVDCVHSPEPPVYPRPDGSVCNTRSERAGADPKEDRRLNCEWGFGSATFVTGAFGFAAAGRVVARLTAAAPET